MHYLNYGILLLGVQIRDIFVSKILKIQKRALWIISNSSYLSHTKPLFERYDTLDINNMYKKEICLRLLLKSLNSLQILEIVITLTLETLLLLRLKFKPNSGTVYQKIIKMFKYQTTQEQNMPLLAECTTYL